MALDTSGNWVAGDDLRLLEALGMQFSQYSLDCLQKCMNYQEDIAPGAVTRVRAILDDYEAAKAAKEAQQLTDTEGKILVQADVLKWKEKMGASGPATQMMDLRQDLMHYYSFCECTPKSALSGMTPLIRS